jgi:hypothetical protein
LVPSRCARATQRLHFMRALIDPSSAAEIEQGDEQGVKQKRDRPASSES